VKDRLVTIALSVVATLGVTQAAPQPLRELEVDRLIVRQELIVSDTGQPWEQGFEKQQIPRGLVARANTEGVTGLWVRSRLIEGELDDPFDHRIHAMNRDGSLFKAPGHISWNVWLDDNWRQMAIIQGEGLENSELPAEEWTGGNHPGRLRFQTFRPHHDEPLTDAILGQGMMSLGGGGYGGGGLPYPRESLQLWGGKMEAFGLPAPAAPTVAGDDGSGRHTYALVAIGAQGSRSPASPTVAARGHATLRWDSVPGSDAYLVLRDGADVSGPLRIEGAQKEWRDAQTR
jgi:hypothetical protein